MKAIVRYAALRKYRRILAVSDIHGNLEYLQGLLKKVSFCPDDALVIVGDITEKGPDSLGTLHCVMQLAKRSNVFVLEGNCDDVRLCDLLDGTELDAFCRYMQTRRQYWNSCSILWEMCRLHNLSELFDRDPVQCQRQLAGLLKDEWRFLRSLPTVLCSEDCCFAHAAVPQDLDHPEDARLEDCIRQDRFFESAGPRFSKTCIVGHWPVVLYGKDKMCANPLFNEQRNIYSIDGGCVLKDDGQLNCLIRENRTGEYHFEAFDRFPILRAEEDQAESADPFHLRWGENRVVLLKKEQEFSRCRHVASGRVLLLPNETLYHDAHGDLCCAGYTDYRLPVRRGEFLSLVLQTGRGCLVKKDGVSGWYFGPVLRLP